MAAENNLGDSVNYQFVQSAYNSIMGPAPEGAISSGNRLAAEQQLGKLQGFVTNPIWHDPAIAGQAQALLSSASGAVYSMTAEQETSGQATFQEIQQDNALQVARLESDRTYQNDAANDVKAIQAGQIAAANGQDPSLAYNGIPDPGGIGTALNLSGQSPKPGLQGLTAGGLAFLGGSTLLVAGVVVFVGYLYLKSARII